MKFWHFSQSYDTLKAESEDAMRTISDLSKEAEQYFLQLELDKDDARNAYRHILSTIDTALASQQYSALSELLSFVEKGDGRLAFQYIGRTHRFLRILHIILLEQKYRKALFCFDCSSAEELWEKYMLTLFAFRRIQFRLSEDSATEAVQYLRSRPVSHFAVYLIVQGELPSAARDFYETLASVFAGCWTDGDIQQFFALTDNASAMPKGESI